MVKENSDRLCEICLSFSVIIIVLILHPKGLKVSDRKFALVVSERIFLHEGPGVLVLYKITYAK